MLERKPSFINISTLITGGLILLIALSTPVTVYAQDPNPPDNGTCILCHENLYYLHDTGNWFCLKESPMACVDCHGGNPTALTQEIAHNDRAPHPVINEDISKCQECHPDQCDERVDYFGKNAGFSEILVAAPYIPAHPVKTVENVPAAKPQEYKELIIIALISTIALAVYFAARIRHLKQGDR